MSMQSIAESVSGARKHLQAHPVDGLGTDSFAHARLRNGLLVEVTGPAGQSLLTDMPKALGGESSAPSPGWVMRAAAASCTAAAIAMRAAELGITLDGLDVEVTSKSDDCGLLGAAEGIPAGPLSVAMRVKLRARATDAAQLKAVADWGIAHSPVADALQRAIPTEIEIAAH